MLGLETFAQFRFRLKSNFRSRQRGIRPSVANVPFLDILSNLFERGALNLAHQGNNFIQRSPVPPSDIVN